MLKSKSKGYDPNFLLEELKRFYTNNKRVPISKDLDYKDCGYPSRKTYVKHFGNLNNALKLAGFNIKEKPNYRDKKYLIDEILRYLELYGKQPSPNDIDSNPDFPCKYYYTEVFGSWSNALREANLTPRTTYYSDEELKEHFLRFVAENGRPPTLHEFNNNPDFPSFWCYQNRYGSWNKAVSYYGFKPINPSTGFYYEFKNGEICKSKYEYDVSTWLRDNKISYLRNVLYREFIEDYYGNKDCDYVIIHNGEWFFLEIAGMYTNRDKKSSVESRYVKRFDHKLNELLIHFNYKVFYPEDFRNRNKNELFLFLQETTEKTWFKSEPLYKGMADEDESKLEVI